MNDAAGSELAARQLADSVVITEESLLPLEDHQLGQVVIFPLEEPEAGWSVVAVRKAGITAEEAAMFESFARHKIYMLALTADPEVAGGWFERRSGDGWQVTCTNRFDGGPLDPFV